MNAIELQRAPAPHGLEGIGYVYKVTAPWGEVITGWHRGKKDQALAEAKRVKDRLARLARAKMGKGLNNLESRRKRMQK